MTLLQTLETEANELGLRFEYAGDLEEANATIFDRITSGEFPVCLVLAFDINDRSRVNGIVRSSAEINALFLKKLPQITIDKSTKEVDLEAVAPMRAKARDFINGLDHSDIIDDNGIESVVHRSTHQALLDCHLYGCWSVFTINFSEDLSTCDH